MSSEAVRPSHGRGGREAREISMERNDGCTGRKTKSGDRLDTEITRM